MKIGILRKNPLSAGNVSGLALVALMSPPEIIHGPHGVEAHREARPIFDVSVLSFRTRVGGASSQGECSFRTLGVSSSIFLSAVLSLSMISGMDNSGVGFWGVYLVFQMRDAILPSTMSIVYVETPLDSSVRYNLKISVIYTVTKGPRSNTPPPSVWTSLLFIKGLRNT